MYERGGWAIFRADSVPARAVFVAGRHRQPVVIGWFISFFLEFASARALGRDLLALLAGFANRLHRDRERAPVDAVTLRTRVENLKFKKSSCRFSVTFKLLYVV